MVYTAGHPILIVCDSKSDYDISESEIERVVEDLKDFLIQFIKDNTKFDPFCVEIMYSNLSNRLKGDQCMISMKVGYLTDIPKGKKRFSYITELDSKYFLHEFKKLYRTYEVLDAVLDLDTFLLHTGEYKDLEFCLGIGEEHNY